MAEFNEDTSEPLLPRSALSPKELRAETNSARDLMASRPKGLLEQLRLALVRVWRGLTSRVASEDLAEMEPTRGVKPVYGVVVLRPRSKETD